MSENESGFVDFQEFADCAIDYRKNNGLSKIIFVSDLRYLGLLFVETNHLFKITFSDAYKSILTYDDPKKDLFLRLLFGVNSSAHREAFTTAIVEKE